MKKGLAVALAAATVLTFAPTSVFAGTTAETKRQETVVNGKHTNEASGLKTTMNETANIWSYDNSSITGSAALEKENTAVLVLTPDNPEGSVTFTENVTDSDAISDSKWFTQSGAAWTEVRDNKEANGILELTAGKKSKTLKIRASVAKLRQTTTPEIYTVGHSNYSNLADEVSVKVILANHPVKMNNLKVVMGTAGDSALDRYKEHGLDEYDAYEARPTGVSGNDISTNDQVDVALDGKQISKQTLNLAGSKDLAFKSVESNADVEYKSDDTSVATVDKDGIHAKGVGNTTITLKTKQSTTSYGEVTVTIPVEVINKPSAKLTAPADIYVNGYGTENAVNIGAAGTNIKKNSIVYTFVYWASAEQDYVAFPKTATATPSKLNPFKLTDKKDAVYVESYTGDDNDAYNWGAYLKVSATAADGYVGPDPVYVKLHFNKDAQFELDSEYQELHVGESVKITAKKADAVSGSAFTYESWNPAVATVDKDGVITAVSEGSTKITVSLGGKSRNVIVTVKAYENGAGSKAAPEKVTGLKVSNKKGSKVSVKWNSQDSSVSFRVYKKVGSGKWIAKNVTSNKATLSVKKGAKVTVKVKAFTKGTNGKTTWGPKATKAKAFKTDRK